MGLTKKELLKREHWKWKYLSPDGTELPPLKENSHDYLPAARPLYDGKPVFDLEIGMVKEDGITIWANANAIPLPFPDWRVVTTIQDISERKRLEKDLQDREERFRKIFDISPIGIQLFSSEGVLINANQSSLNILGWKDSKHAKVPNLLRDALEDEDIRQKLLSGQTWHDGRWISLKPIKATKNKNDSQEGPGRTYIDYIITPLGKSGDPEGYIVILHDLTEKKLAQDALISDNERLQIIYDLWKARVKMSEIKMELERKS
jgi:PAS domain-containing protein